MSTLMIGEPLASRIRAQAAGREQSPEAFLESLLQPTRADLPEFVPRPASSLTDSDIDLPQDVTTPAEQAAYREAVRRNRPLFYAIAREYWARMGDSVRLSLTDEQLDKVFWIIDREGVPRFKEEKSLVQRGENPLRALVGIIPPADDLQDLSMSVRETLEEKYGSAR
jgi:hypothetical protein